MTEEIFGPVITIYVYDESQYERLWRSATELHRTLQILFHSLLRDRYAIDKAFKLLRYSAGNFI